MRAVGVNLYGFEPQLRKLEFIIYLPKLKVHGRMIDDLMLLVVARAQKDWLKSFGLFSSSRAVLWLGA